MSRQHRKVKHRNNAHALTVEESLNAVISAITDRIAEDVGMAWLQQSKIVQTSHGKTLALKGTPDLTRFSERTYKNGVIREVLDEIGLPADLLARITVDVTRIIDRLCADFAQPAI